MFLIINLYQSVLNTIDSFKKVCTFFSKVKRLRFEAETILSRTYSAGVPMVVCVMSSDNIRQLGCVCTCSVRPSVPHSHHSCTD